MKLTSVRQWMQNGEDSDLLLDLRSRQCFLRGHLPGAVSRPYEDRKEWLRELPKNRRIVLICRRGTTAIQMARELDALGYSTAVIVGGYHQLGYPDCD